MKLDFVPLLVILLILGIFISGCEAQELPTNPHTTDQLSKTPEVTSPITPPAVPSTIGQWQKAQPTTEQQTEPQTQECTTNWQCSAWSECISLGKQTRTCTDKNNCGVGTGKPSESQSCTPEVRTNCPDFSSLSDRVSCQAESCWFTILDSQGKGIAKVGEYKLYPWDATPGQFYPHSYVQAPCNKGIEKGENVNYFYCEGMYIIVKETDSAGNILSSKKLAVKLVVHNSKIIDSICD